MKPARNSLWSRIGRYVTFGVIATALAGAVMFLHWRHDRREVPTDPSLTGLASQMRHDAAAWTRQEKDASEMLRDIHDDHVAAIGVSPNAILVSTTKGEKYFVTDHNAVFSNALLLDEMKAGSSSPYQLVWLPDADIHTGTARWADVFDKTRDALSLLLPFLLMGGLAWFMRREMRGGASLLGKSPAIRFDDVIGAGEAKAALGDVQAYLTDPMQFTGMGVRAPCGILMTGGPGVGKTRLAQALAGECKQQELSRRSFVDAARAKIEKRVLFHLTDGGAVRALYVVGVNFQLRLGVDLSFARKQQIAICLLRVGLLRVFVDDDATMKHAVRASAKNAIVKLAAAAVRLRVLDQHVVVQMLAAGSGEQAVDQAIAAFAVEDWMYVVANDAAPEE